MKKRVTLGVAVLAALCFAGTCDKDEKKTKTHPGCPGESSRSVDDPVACTCGSGKQMQAGSLTCKDCDPTGSSGIYCDCGQNKVFSMNGRLDTQIGLTFPQVECVPVAKDAADAGAECPTGSYVDTSGACVKCADTECGGSCGVCPVGGTCISGQCIHAFACRAHTIYPYCEDVPATDEQGRDVVVTQCIKESQCDYAKNDQCNFAAADDIAAGEPCSCSQDSHGCEYDGVAEPLSQ